MNIWLDDQREAPKGWIHLHNFKEVEQLINLSHQAPNFRIDTMSFDFNLSDSKNGLDVMKYLYKTKKLWPKKILLHSTDPKGLKKMSDYLTSIDLTLISSTQ